MSLQRGVVRMLQLDVGVMVRAAGDEWKVLVWPAVGIVDRETFFAAVRSTLPLDPPLESSSSWDAMSDSLWEGLHGLPERRIIIVWPNATVLAQRDPSCFEMAVDVLTDVVTLLADESATVGRPQDVMVLVEDRFSTPPS